MALEEKEEGEGEKEEEEEVAIKCPSSGHENAQLEG